MNHVAGARRLAPPPGTHHSTVLALVIVAGIVSAFQVGKAPVALQSLRIELGADMGAVSWVLSAFALVGAIASLLVGAVSDRIHARRAVIAGLVLQALGSALGASAPGLPSLLSTRVLEGLGFLAVTVAGPAMVAASTAPSSRKKAFAAWATFMPVGMATVMLAAPWLQESGWRCLWWGNAVLLACVAAALAIATRRPVREAAQGAHAGGLPGGLRDTLRLGGAWFLAGQFCAYTAAYFALFGFLPSLLADRLGVGEGVAGMLSAIAVGAGAAGCVTCGVLLRRGQRPSNIIVAGFSAIALCSAGILLVPLPGEASYLLCVVFSFAGAFIPVVVFDAAPRLATRPTLLGSVLGLANQGNNAGMVIGPVAAGAIASHAGWQWVAPFVVAIALVATACALRYRHQLDKGDVDKGDGGN